MPVDERTFVAQVASWIDEILARRSDLPYGEARVEEPLVQSRKRLDLKIFRRGSQTVALTGEVKMPDKPYGRNHLDMELISDAFEKASRLGSPYYFTWNVNRFALFQTHQDNVPFTERRVEDRQVTRIESSDAVHDDPVQAQIKTFWEELLQSLRDIEAGRRTLVDLPLDRRCIVRLEEALEEPVDLTFAAARAQYSRDDEFGASLFAWMREEQGWEVDSDEESGCRAIERAARLSCYVLANRPHVRAADQPGGAQSLGPILHEA